MRYLVVLAAVALCAVGCGSKGAVDTSTRSTSDLEPMFSAMEKTGFKTVHRPPVQGERVVTEQYDVGNGIEFKSICYTGGMADQMAICSVTNKATGQRISRWEELQLYLNGKIPLGVYANGWLPIKHDDFEEAKTQYGEAITKMTFEYAALGAKVEKIGAWKGYPVYRVTKEGIVPYIAVEEAGNRVTYYLYEYE